jgi:hypothetical protein
VQDIIVAIQAHVGKLIIGLVKNGNMIKLIDILKEMYIDQQGNLVDKSDFVVKQTGYFDLILIDKDKINLNDYIYFESKYSNWSRSKIANTIFKQLMTLYQGTAIEKYNNNIGFTPTKKILRGGGFDVPSLSITFAEGIDKWEREGEKNVFKGWKFSPLYVETPIDLSEYTLDGRTFPATPGLNDEPIDLGPGEKAKVALSNNDDVESKLEYLNITFIPFVDIPNYGRGEYKSETKSDIVDAFNDIGLEALNLLKQ